MLALDGTNTTPLTVRGAATVQVPTVASLGAADMTLDGGGLRVSVSDTLSGTVLLGAAGGAQPSAGTGQTLNLDATVSGGNLTKSGQPLSSAPGVRLHGYDRRGWRHPEPRHCLLARGYSIAAHSAYTGAAASFAQPVTIDSGTEP